MNSKIDSARGRAFALSVLAVAAMAAGASAHAQAVFTGGFEGTSQLDNCALGECFRPPDTMGAVGITQFVETSNGSVTVYDKGTGAVLSRVNMATFWTAAGLPGGGGGDQRVLFDHYTNRWIMNGFGATGNLINIGVSDTANALGTWKSTQIVGTSLGVGGTLDYPTLAIDNKGVYIGTNNFNPSYTGSSLFVIPKASLFGGAPSTAGLTQFTGSANGNAIQAAVNWQGNPGNTVSVVSDSNFADAQAFFKVNGVNAGGATQTAAGDIAGTAYTVAGKGRQPDGSRRVDTLSPRITANAVQYNGMVFYTATVRADVGDFAAVRWSVVDASSGALLSTGKIQGGNFDYYEGAIAVNEFGEAVIGYNRSGSQTADTNADGKADGNISFMAMAFDVSGGALVQDGGEMLLKVSSVSDYHPGERFPPCVSGSTNCRDRWGDYAAVTIDPTNHHNFYAIGEYAADWAVIPGFTTTERAIWHTYIAEISMVPEPSQYALLMLGLGVIGFASRKRKQA